MQTLWIKGTPTAPGWYWRWSLENCGDRTDYICRRWYDGVRWHVYDDCCTLCSDWYADYYAHGDMAAPVESPGKQEARLASKPNLRRLLQTTLVADKKYDRDCLREYIDAAGWNPEACEAGEPDDWTW
jgi:hypothetical protein